MNSAKIQALGIESVSGSGVSSLPGDIIFEVLLRLPVKALCRFRCVSKAWHALISDPAFVAAQRSHAGRLIVAKFGSWPRYELWVVLDMQGNVLRVFKASGCYDHRSTRLDLIFVNMRWQGAMVIDPAARRSFTVGRQAHDEEIQWSNYSFGRVAPPGAYKILRLSDTHTKVCEVATIRDNGEEPTWWRRPTPDWFNGFSDQPKATVNGVLYFMHGKIGERTPGWNRVAAFDLESEMWMDTINGPPLEEQEDWWIAVTELKESLCMVHNIRRTENLGGERVYSEIWRLIDRNKGVWVKAHTIRLPIGCTYTEALDALDDGKILLLNRICSRFVLQSFNSSTEAFTNIMKLAEEFSGGMTFYTWSLLYSGRITAPN